MVGSLIGLLLAYFSYRQYYPSLASELSHRPYGPRIKREEHEILPSHRHAPSQGQSLNGNGVAVDRYADDEQLELEGTVPRPRPHGLEDEWIGDGDEHPTESRTSPYKTPYDNATNKATV